MARTLVDCTVIISDFELGKNALAGGDTAVAIAYFQAVVTDQPDNWDCWLLLAQAFADSEQTATATRTYRFVASNCPDEQIKTRAHDWLKKIS